jgi:hypothetical protein
LPGTPVGQSVDVAAVDALGVGVEEALDLALGVHRRQLP